MSNLIGSRRWVVGHGEVFTLAWVVGAMADLVKSHTERIGSQLRDILRPARAYAPTVYLGVGDGA